MERKTLSQLPWRQIRQRAGRNEKYVPDTKGMAGSILTGYSQTWGSRPGNAQTPDHLLLFGGKGTAKTTS